MAFSRDLLTLIQLQIAACITVAALSLVGCGNTGYSPTPVSSTVFSLSSISPTISSLAGGATLTLTGSSFDTDLVVKIDTQVCSSLKIISTTSAQCLAPAHAAGTVDIVVQSAGNTARLTSALVYADSTPAPTLTSVSPNTGITFGGTTVTVTGSNFFSGAKVSFGGAVLHQSQCQFCL